MFPDIFDELKKIKEKVEKAFEDLFKKPEFEELKKAGEKFAAFRMPPCDVLETDGEVVVRAALPGIEKENILVNVDEHSVEITAEKKAEEVEEKKGYYRRERAYKGFYRKIALPTIIDPDRASARFENGVLEVRAPKIARKEKKKLEVE